MAAKIYLDFQAGLKMPAIGIGTGGIRIEEPINVALEAGYRHFDTADSYRNEEVLGKVLNEWISAGKLKREDLFITTKLPHQGMHPDRIEMFLKKSLENLQLDYVDLYLIHFPVATKYVEGQPYPPLKIETEDVDHIVVWKKMEEQVDAGRTKTIGLSNFNIRQIDRILKSARIKPACLQIELHVYLQQRELVNYCQQNGIVVVAYTPLGNPAYNAYLIRLGKKPKKLPDMLHNNVIQRIADKHKKTSAQVMLRYLLQKNVAAIPKSVTPVRIQQNIDVFDFALDTEDMELLDDLEVGEEARVCDFKAHKEYSEHPEWPFPR